MYLLTEWEGHTGKYLAQGQDARTKRSEVCASWPRAKYFLVWPNLTQSISILSYDHFFFSFSYFWLNEDTHISSRAVHVFLALSPQLVQPSYGNFILMVFRGNCTRGHTGHVINSFIFTSGYLCTEGVEGHPHRAHPSPHFLWSLSADWSYPEMDEHKLYHLWVTA